MTDAPDRWIVDRFEGGFAVCQNAATKAMRDVPRAELPEGVREGTSLVLRDGAWALDPADEAARAERIRRLMDDLFEK